MTLEEKKQIYLDRFPAIIGRRMAEQYDGYIDIQNDDNLCNLVAYFKPWPNTNEGSLFWLHIMNLFAGDKEIEHQQILDIFHKHNIKP